MVKSFCIALLFCLTAFPAFACAMLEHGDPKVGSVVSPAPDHIALTFSGKIYPQQSMLSVTDAAGHIMSEGKPYGDDTTLAIKLTSLPAGVYKVSWNTWCDCKSYTPGDYKFTVR